jgi:cytochrome c
MSDLTFNKVAGAVLATGLAITGLTQLSAGVFEPEEVKKPGYLVEVAEEAGAGGAAVEAPIDWGTVLPTADVAAGEAVFAKCKSCHTAEAGGANGTGPNLYGVVGRKPGSHAGFAYSAPMTEFGAKQAVWDDEHISEFIKAPQKYIGGTKMTFVGLKKPEDRINIIAYLRSQGGTLPVPAPNPARPPPRPPSSRRRAKARPRPPAPRRPASPSPPAPPPRRPPSPAVPPAKAPPPRLPPAPARSPRVRRATSAPPTAATSR